ncbi:acyl-homoserine-lactone synthase [Ruegeria jejuensis]|uniref:acyl-homoserine-lactone synthase n=1 Tax=Ruegeria jejuensis TaxID=3233338 RepID=UPI00355BE00B
MIDVKILPFNAEEADQEYIDKYFRLRKQVFIDKMGWELFEAIGYEMDEYDCHAAIYAIAVDTVTGVVLGGARLIRTTREEYSSSICVEPNSYMIRDAYLQRIEGIPANLCFSLPPVDPAVWELTRFVSVGNMRVGPLILTAVNDHLASIGARECLFLGPPTFMRMAKIMKFSPKPLGNLVANEHATFLAFSCEIVRERPAGERATKKESAKKTGAFPVAELFDVTLERVGIVFKWNTGDEEVSWTKDQAGGADASKYRRVDLPSHYASGPKSNVV